MSGVGGGGWRLSQWGLSQPPQCWGKERGGGHSLGKGAESTDRGGQLAERRSSWLKSPPSPLFLRPCGSPFGVKAPGWRAAHIPGSRKGMTPL